MFECFVGDMNLGAALFFFLTIILQDCTFFHELNVFLFYVKMKMKMKKAKYWKRKKEKDDEEEEQGEIITKYP